MHISVVIPTHNRSHTLPRALDSVLNQTNPADQVIVVDDGSSDATGELIDKYPDVEWLQQENKGVSAARNRGIEAAEHDWIALLDSDDEWLPGKLEMIRHNQSENPQYRLYHSDEIWIRRGVRVNPMKKHQKRGGMIYQHCLPLCVISPSAVVLHKELLLEAKGFDESLPACEDYDLWLRLCCKHPVYYIDQPLIKKYGGHEDQLSARYWGMDRFRIRAMYRLFQRNVLNQEQSRLTQAMLLRKLDILLKGANKHRNQALIDEFGPIKQELQRRC